MKTTQDSNQGKVQEDQVTLESKQQVQQADSQQLANQNIEQSATELENAASVEQLDLALADGNADTKPAEAKDKVKKSKKDDKKAEEEAVADEQLLADAEEEVVSADEQSEQSVDELSEEASEESLISEALQDQDDTASASSGASVLSMTTIALGAVSLIGVATYYKNTDQDKAPSITSGDSATVEENSGEGQVVYTAAAVDDAQTGITYSLSSGSDSALNIDSVTGKVTLSVDSDHEVQAEYSFVIIATDEAGNSSQQAVTLTVTDLDDAAPVITSSNAVVVDENLGAGQIVYTTESDDSADVSSGSVSYALSSDSDDALSINASTGEVTLASNPDHETQSEFNFTVIATDGAGNASEQAVTLSVNNLDEVAPAITSPALASIDENSGAAQVVYTAAADDSSDISGGVSFSLSSDSDAALTIDSTTGAVTLATDPDHETQSEYNFTVVATDVAGNASEQAVVLSVVDLDDTAPTITSGDSVSLVENSGAGQVVYTAIADDSGDVSNGDVVYSLSAGSDSALSINAATGAVTLAADPDYEVQSSYDFAVVATDTANNASEQAVTLSITNLDDTAPAVTSASTASVDENSAANQVIYTAVADDSADISDGVTYSLEDTTQYPPAEDDNDAGPVVSDVSIPVLGDATNLQRVYVSSSVKSVDGTQETVVISYQSDDSTLTGLGLRIHFDSSVLSLSAVSDLFAQDQIDADATPAADTADLDGDATTDTYIDFAWASLFGNWPNSGSADLATLTFDIAADATGSSPINFSVSSNAAGYTFEGQSHSVAITEEGEASNSQLSIDATTGEVALSVSPDFEVLPAYSFNITATDAAGNVSDQQAVTVAVNNLDEVAPVITSGDTAIAIDENSGAGQVVYTAVADDSGDISEGVSYSLAAGSDAALTIDEATGEVSLTVDPDHEAQDQYSFTVVATDVAGNQSVAQAVTLSVTDLDDTAPTITSSATVSVDEQTGADQVVYTATSDDSADVASGDVVYSLSGSEVVNNPQPQLNADSQMVYVSQSTLSEDGKASVTVSYNADDSTVTGLGLRVHFDSQALSLTDVADVLAADLIVNVADLSAEADSANFDNDASTDSYITLAWASLFGNWPGAALPQDLLTLEFDVASDATGTTNIGFSSSSSAVGFTFDASAYALATEASGDPSDPALSIDGSTGEVTLSTDPDYETQSGYSFTVVATDPAGNASEQEVTLSVNNVDDVPPAIISPNNVAIVEGSGAGQVIYTAVADDSGDISGGVTFGLLNNDNADLTIDATTGEVTLAADPDYETAPEFNFTVMATDAAGNTSVKNVDVSVSNVDDTDPTITSAAAVSVDENSGAGEVVYTATADDSGDISDGVTFSLAVGSDPSLSIDAVSGEVTLAANPDQEAQDQYSFTVVATDAAGNAVDQAVTLSITDLDDTAPTVTSGAVANAIDENSGAAQVIYTATADDSADVSDGPITFSLSGDSDSGLSIDATSGAVTLSGNPDFETKSQYSFTVIATDAASNASVGETVTLDINNIDDTAPVITSGDTATAIDENSGADQVVYTAVADDSADVSGGVNFSLAAGSDAALSIDANSGEVTLSTDPDYDVQSEYSFTVVATDTAGNASERAVTFSINNVDEVAPTITSLNTASVIENTGAGQVVYVARAEDDGDISDGVSFSLSGDSDAALTIDSETGQVTLASNPQFAVQSEYVLTVIATDVAGNSTEQAVTLSVVDVDAENPVFVSDTTSAVDENIGVEQVIYTASANDQSVVSYSLSGDSDPALSIDAVSGAVTLSSNPDHETQDTYSFTVIATDTSGNDSARSVTVAVDNLDELAPTITSAGTATAVNENSGVAQVVYTVTANDNADDVTSEPLSYSLSDDGAGAFSIDANSGAVTLNANPDFEAQSEYSFTVVATDAAGNSSDQVVALSVNNLDEVAPSITSGDGASVVENSGAGQVIYTATSDDSADLSDGVSYSLSGDSDAALSIDANTGEVTLTADPDYQVQTSYAFTVIATDDAGNAGQQAVTLAVTETVPLAPSLSLVNDSGLSDSDGITGDGEIAVSDLKAGATWEYSIDGGASWTAGVGTSFELTVPDSYTVAVRQSNTAGTSEEGQLDFVLDQSAPQVDSVEVDTTNQVIKVLYNETLGEATPSIEDYSVKLGSADLTVNSVSIDGSAVVLTVAEALAAGALQISYSPSDSGGALVEDLVGNQATDGFSQFVVSDGYIRDVRVYADRNEDGIADAEELLEVTSDARGQVLIEGDDANAQLIIKGGVNTDTGAVNELELTAPKGFSVINPLTTLVEEVQSSSEEVITVQDAETKVLSALGINLSEGEELSSYDPLSDVSESSVDNRRVTIQIATVLAVASAVADENNEDVDTNAIVLGNLAEVVNNAAANAEQIEAVSLNSEQVVDEVLKDVVVEDDAIAALKESVGIAVQALEDATSIEEIVKAQADAIDRVAPSAPEPNLAPQSDKGISDSDNLTNDTNPTVRISFDVSSTKGEAAVVGDTVEVFNTGVSVAAFTLSQEDIDLGYVDYSLSDLTAGNSFVSAAITDIAGNASYLSSLVFTVDTTLPTFDSSNEASVEENVAESTVVYTASVSDGDLWKFELAEDSDSGLSIDASTGEVSLSVSPDFEAQLAYNFTVLATDNAGNTSSQAVVLNITNADDTAPQITSGSVAEAVDENSAAGQVVYTATADDSADVSETPISYSLSEDSNPAFSIDAVSGEVTLDEVLDYEAQSEYSFTVIATDAAGNVSDGQAVSLAVNNLDELAPLFTSSAVADVIVENSGAGQVVYTAQAVDNSADVISNPVTYSLSDNGNGAFSIDAGTGEVTLSDNPDYESKASYSFTVVASDALGHSSEQAVSLAVEDVFDLKPVFDLDQSAPVVDENNELDYTVSASVDPQADQYDIGPDLVFSLSDDANGVFSIDSATGAVSMSPLSDYETQNQYSFTVVATDDAGNSADKTFGLSVNDLDEIAPTITSGDVADDLNADSDGQLDENSGADQVIYTATADDSLDISAGVTFSLSGDSDVALSIDANTGVVTLSDNPDHETQSSYSFTVVASDGVNADVSQSVSLDINDLDDTAAIVTSGDTATVIDENSGAGQVIYTATADDSADVSDGVAYSLAAGSDTALSIDANTGAVTLANDPDQETQNQYSFTVVATDAAGNVSEGQAVTLNINDLDETAPTITSGDTAAAIDENSGAGQVIYTATADDSADVSGGVSFSLAAGSDAALSIDAVTGEVSLATDPDFETQDQYSFTLIATDAAGNANQQVVTLAINNLDEGAPVITSGDTATAIDENSGADQVIYTVISDDAEAVYSLAEGSDAALSIDAVTGEVSLSADPDYETQTEYNFTVVATDVVGNASEQAVTLAVNNFDDTAPTITSAESVSLVENSGANQVVYVATADDSADMSGGVSFDMVDNTIYPSAESSSASGASSVSIPEVQAATQHVYVSESTRSEDGTQETVVISYNASAVSTGLGLRIHYNSSALTLADASGVLANSPIDMDATPAADSNNLDNDARTDTFVDFAWASLFGGWPGAGEHSLATLTFDIAEGATGSSTINFSASSNAAGFAFAGQSHDVVISAEAGPVGPQLSIDAATGEVTLSADPDYEALSEYNFTLEATDAAGNASEQAVTLSVTDVDDTLVVTSGDTASVEENSGAGQIVYTATADNNADAEAAVSFMLGSGSDDALSINSATGEITLTEDPDHETQDQYQFTVIAIDTAGNETVGQVVTLSVNNLDEAAPTFTSSSIASIAENSGVGQVIYTAVADDSADHSDGVTYSLSVDSVLHSQLGVVEQQFVDNGDGSMTLRLLASDSIVDSYPDGIENIDLVLSYNASEVGHIAAEQIVAPGNPFMGIVNATVSDEITGAYTYFPSGLNLANEARILEVTFDLEPGVTSAWFETSGVRINEDDLTDMVSESRYLDDEALSIDATTGAVTLAIDPDYESQPLYSFTVTATDEVGMSDEQAVVVNVTDMADIVPIITSGDTATAIDENSGADQVVYTAASDMSEVTYSLAEGSDSGLSINATTGEVTLTVNPNYESQSEYSFVVVATDASGSASSGKSVTLSVNDIDEVAPSITSGNTATAIDENSGAAQVIYTATSDDDGATYSLAAGSDVALSIDANSGQVTLNLDPNYEAQPSYSFTVIATDEAGMSGEQAVTLDISDADEVAPSITSGPVANFVEENSGEAQVVYTATAADGADISAGVTFSLAAGSDSALSIDANTGAVTLNVDPNYEAQSSYSFTVVASDAVQQSEQAVTLDIGNQDEMAPFIVSQDQAVVYDNVGENPVIYTAIADDSADISDGVTFSFEDNTQYASTGGGSAETVVSIPQVEAATQHVYVSESTKSEDGTQETVVVTYNSDDTTTTGLGLRIHYNSSALTLSNLAGVLTNSAIDADGTPAADASDLDGDAATDTYIDFAWASLFGSWPGAVPTDLATLTFDIADGATGSSAINFSASSNAAGFTFAGQSQDLVLSAAAEPVASQLSIDANTGEVTLAGEPNPQVQSEYNFTVTATDVAGNSSSQAVTVASEAFVPTLTSGNLAIIEEGAQGAAIYTASTNLGDVTYNMTDATTYASAGGGSAETVVSIPDAQSATQQVYVSESTKSEDGTQETVVVTYSSDDTTTTGLGLRIHYDSSAVTLSEVAGVLTNSPIDADGTPAADTSDLDGDAATDTYIDFAWASLFGSWPGAVPTDLATLTFDIADGATGSTPINFSASSNAAGFTFAGQSQDLVLSAESGAVPPALVVDNQAGTVTLDAPANREAQSTYQFTVEATDAEGATTGVQTVNALVVDYLVSSDDAVTGTDEAEIFALGDGSAQITSGGGADIFILAPDSGEDYEEHDGDYSPGDEHHDDSSPGDEYDMPVHTLVDFESGVDSIDVSAALMSLGYTGLNNSLDSSSAQDFKLSQIGDIPQNLEGLIDTDDSSLDNIFGGFFDASENTLTIFADMDATAGNVEADFLQIKVGEGSTVDEDDLVFTFDSFIA